MPISKITTLRPSFASEAVADKVKACVDFMEYNLPKIYYKHLTGAYTWFMYKQWRFDNTTSTSPIRFNNNTYFPYNAGYSELLICDRASLGGHMGWMKFVNDFAYLNIGLIYASYDYSGNGSRTNITIMPGYVSKTIYSISDFNTAKFYIPYSTSYHNKAHTILGSYNAYASLLDDFKLYTYQSNYFSYVGFMNMDRCVVATRAYNIDDPTQEISVIVISCINDEEDDYRNMMAANTIDIIMQESRVPKTYTDTIDNMPQTTSYDKFVMYKFVQDGYYFNNIFTYTGTLPSNHFYYNGSEYIKIACNLLLKFD